MKQNLILRPIEAECSKQIIGSRARFRSEQERQPGDRGAARRAGKSAGATNCCLGTSEAYAQPVWRRSRDPHVGCIELVAVGRGVSRRA